MVDELDNNSSSSSFPTIQCDSCGFITELRNTYVIQLDDVKFNRVYNICEFCDEAFYHYRYSKDDVLDIMRKKLGLLSSGKPKREFSSSSLKNKHTLAKIPIRHELEDKNRKTNKPKIDYEDVASLCWELHYNKDWEKKMREEGS